MKVILMGPTGFIGREVLDQCLKNSSISAVVAVSRSDLQIVDPKLRISIVDDFLTYPESLVEDMKDADACMWCLGRTPSSEINEARKVCLDYTITGLQAMTPTITKDEGWKFRFIYLSGGAAERDQTKTLWFAQEYRHMRGQVENAILSHANDNQSTLEVVIMKPGFVLAKQQSVRDIVRGLGPSVRVDVLAQAMIASVFDASGRQVIENTEIRELGA